MKTVISRLVEAGRLTLTEARAVLIGELQSWAEDGRTVYFGPNVPDTSVQ
jgi:hypothetical protein